MHTDSAVDVLPRRHPFQIAAPIVPLVAVNVVHLGAVGTTASNKSLCHKNVDTYV